jgi:GNAT superfamily N-acetyltransferase
MQIEQATIDDGVDLAEIRAKAMKPSLEAVGRFDENRVRARFLDKYDPECTKKFFFDGQLVGFYLVRKKADHLLLDHLYIVPENQGSGIGKSVLDKVKAMAKDLALPIRLCALCERKSNDFYKSNGFIFQYEEGFDIYYEWSI